MKKTISLLAMGVLMLSLVACATKEKETSAGEETTNNTTTTSSNTTSADTTKPQDAIDKLGRERLGEVGEIDVIDKDSYGLYLKDDKYFSTIYAQIHSSSNSSPCAFTSDSLK